MDVKLLSANAIIPSRATAGSAGYDLHSIEEVSINHGNRILVGTGISIKLEKDTYARIAPRSGLSNKGIDVCAGVIDMDYRGEIKVMLHNTGCKHDIYKIEKGDRIAQLIIEVIKTPTINVVDNLDETERGEGGFGSTGI